jgi:hypothetical protein
MYVFSLSLVVQQAVRLFLRVSGSVQCLRGVVPRIVLAENELSN